MRWKATSAAVMVLAALSVPVASSGAAPTDVSALAADCADGRVDIDGRISYVGGSGSFAGSCVVAMQPGSTLTIAFGSLTGGGIVVTGGTAENDTTVRVIGSELTMSGPLELTAGCCAGDATIPADRGRVTVRSSRLTGSSIFVNASFDAFAGRVTIASSDVIATSGDIFVVASNLAGSDGRLRVVRSSFATSADLTLSTGTNGRTIVRRNQLMVGGAVDIATGPGGRCATSDNTPTVACTP